MRLPAPIRQCLVVVSGQVAIGLGGHLIGATIEEQTVRVKG